MKYTISQILLQSSAYESGKYVGKAIFYLVLAGLGVYILIRINKKKKK
jgi:hypothetical protein